MTVTKDIRNRIALAVILLLMTAAAVFVFTACSSSGREDELKAIKDAVARRALECYVIEGAYPGSLRYLTENYGLAVNTRDYRIIYIAYAENLPPEIKVVPKEAE